MSVVQWYHSRDGAQGGPVGEAELRQKLMSGEIRLTDLVWREGMAQWQPAGRVAEFAGAGPPVVAPPPLPAYSQAPPLSYAGPYYGQPLGDIGQDAGVRMLIPVGRSGWAIASGYLGLLSIFPFVGCLFGIGAVITGVLAIKDMKANPQRHGMGRAVFGLITGALFTIAWGIGSVMLLANSP